MGGVGRSPPDLTGGFAAFSRQVFVPADDVWGVTDLADDNLIQAFARIEAFLAVQRGARGVRLVEAVECLQAAAGVGPAERRQIAHGLARLDALNPRAGDAMLGILIGSLAASEAAEEALV